MSHLVPFVDISRQKIRKRVESEIKLVMKLTGSEDKTHFEFLVNNTTEDRLRDEIKNGIQTIQYQVNTINSANGQTPFVSVFMYLNEVEEGRARDDLAMIIEEVLNQRYIGTKNEKGIYTTPSFPKLLYVLQEDNITPDGKYWYLTELAAKCTAKRMVPDYISEKIMMENRLDANGEGHTYPCINKSCA